MVKASIDTIEAHLGSDVSTEFVTDTRKGKGELKVPTITLTDEVLSLDRTTKEWKKLVADVANACENYGIFVLEYPKVTVEKQNDLFKGMKMLFDSPMERKRLYKKENVREGGYMESNSYLPLYEAFAIYKDALNEVRYLDKLMLPESTDTFASDSINFFNIELGKLFHHLMELVFDGLGIPQHAKKESTDKIDVTLRIARYDPPLDLDDNRLGLVPHVDKSAFTFLYQNGVQGLEAKDANGTWKNVVIPDGTALVFLGDLFQVWSNGKYKGVEHRVMMKPGIERYSYTCFFIPKDERKFEVPPELVDDEHPLGYKPFTYGEYLQSMGAYSCGINTLKNFAGLESGLNP